MQEMTWPKRACATFTALAMTLAIVPVLPGGAPEAQASDTFSGSIVQTAATANSVTISWPARSDANRWTVSWAVKKGSSSASHEYTYNENRSSVTISNMEADSYVSYFTVKGYKASNSSDWTYDYYGSCYDNMWTKPSKVGRLQLYKPFSNGSSYYEGYRLSVSFASASSSSDVHYAGELYNAKGKKVQTVTAEGNYSYSYMKFNKAAYNQMYRVRIRPYIELANTATPEKGATKVYGAWSSWFYAAPSVHVSAKKSQVKKSKFTVRWSKNKNAKKYYVYVAKSKYYYSTSNISDLSFKKVATLSSKKKSYTVKKVGKKKVNTKKYYYYAYVVAAGKVSGKTVKSKPVECIYCRTY